MRRLSAVDGVEAVPVFAGVVYLPDLCLRRAEAPLVGCCDLGGGCAGLNAAAAAVIADTVHRYIADDGVVDVRVVDDCPVDVHDCGVVTEITAIPATAVEPLAGVAIAVVDAAVEAYCRAPVAGVPCIYAVIPAPVAGSPEKSDGRGFDPGSRNPVVVAVACIPGPVAGCPDVVCGGTGRLIVDGKRRRGDGNGDCHLRGHRAW